MNNNAKFDPMTGEPLQNNNNAEVPVMPQIQQIPEQQTVENNAQIQQNNIQISDQNNINQGTQIQSQLQTIPTVEQNKQDFINNVQSMNQEKKEEKKDNNNLIFIIVLFVALLAIVYFLFPILLDYI